MEQELNIGIIGDYNPQKPSHKATSDALKHAADHLSIKTNVTDLPATEIPVVKASADGRNMVRKERP